MMLLQQKVTTRNVLQTLATLLICVKNTVVATPEVKLKELLQKADEPLQPDAIYISPWRNINANAKILHFGENAEIGHETLYPPNVVSNQIVKSKMFDLLVNMLRTVHNNAKTFMKKIM